jgi:excisionase family DNA binding protein
VSTTDAFAEIIKSAVADGVRQALNIHDATNRRLLSVEQSAEYLNLSKREIWDMIAQHELPVVARGRRKMVDIQDLDGWIQRNTS